MVEVGQKKRTTERLWLKERVDTARAKMLATLAAALKPENVNANWTIYTDKYNIAERFLKGRVTNNLEAKL